MRFIFSIFILCLCTHGYGQNGDIEKKLQSHLSKVSFIENKNQWSEEVKYLSRISGQNIWFMEDNIRFDASLKTKLNNSFNVQENRTDNHRLDTIHSKGQVWDMKFVKSNSIKKIKPYHKKSTYNNYFIGNDSNKWASHVGIYEQIEYENLYDNISLKYYGNEENTMEFDFIIKPHGDVSKISFYYEGLEHYEINSKGELLLKTKEIGELLISKPVAYQIIKGKKNNISVNYELTNGKISFKIGKYNADEELIIDPVLKYCTYLSCINCDDYNYDIDANDRLEVAVTGYTISVNFPTTTGAYSNVLTGSTDIYISKLNAAGNSLIYSTFLGGSSSENGYSLSFDKNDNLIVTGYTNSLNFPLINPLFTSITGTTRVFVTKFDSSGSIIVFSSVVPSNSYSYGYGVATDDSINVYVVGYTNSTNFPTTSGVIRQFNSNNLYDGFAMKINPSGTNLMYNTLIGGLGSDYIRGVKVDANQNAYVVGYTSSNDFHISAPGYQKSISGTQDGFLAKINPTASNLLFSTYIGGSSSETFYSITLDKNFNPYIVGVTNSLNFPTTPSAYKPLVSNGDIVVSKFNSTGLNLLNSTGIGIGTAYGITTNECGFIIISGYTSSSSFPISSDAHSKNRNGIPSDNVVVVLDSALQGLVYSTYFGGSKTDYGEASVAFKAGSFFVSATTHSYDYPTTPGALQTTRATTSDDSPVIFSFNNMCFLPNPEMNANPLFFCDSTPSPVTFKGKIKKGCNADTTNVVLKWTKGYQRTLIGYGDSITKVLKIGDTVYGLAIDTLYLCQSKEFIFIPNFVHTQYNVNLCLGQSYLWNGINLTVSGSYRDTFLTGNNCDSIVTLNLTIFNPSSSLPKSICFTDSFLWNGVYRKTTGSYRDTFPSYLGCDSIVTLSLTINTPSKSIVRYICPGDSTLWNGIYRKISGLYKDTFYGSICDTIVTLSLSYTGYKFGTISKSICIGDSFYFNGYYRKNSGPYYDTLISSIFCDSFLTLNLVYYGAKYYSSVINICSGQSYPWNGKSLDTTGFYIDSFISIYGCDSIHTIILNVNPVHRDTFQVDLCLGITYWWNDQFESSTGFYPDTFINEFGCDSIVTLHLIIHTEERDTLNVNICSYQTYNWKGSQLNTIGTYYDTLLTTIGCDSFIVLYLDILPPNPIVHFYETICEGKSYSWNNLLIRNSGIYPDTFVNSKGCDSIIHLHLFIIPANTYVIFDTICQGNSYLWNAEYKTTSGIYADTFSNSNGCDSIVNLTLTVKNYIFKSFFDTICQSNSYIWNGIQQINSGLYNDTMTSTISCDTIITLHLWVKPIVYSSIYDTICEGHFFSFNGTQRSITGIYKDTLISSSLCDSILSLNLYVKPNLKSLRVDTICLGQSIKWNNYTISNTGVYHDTALGSNGCDSFTTLTVTVKPKPIIKLNKCINPGNYFNLLGKNYSLPGQFIDSTTNGFGCDTIYQLKLTQLYPTTLLNYYTSCNSYTFKGTTYFKTDSLFNSIQSVNGCDSVYYKNYITITILKPRQDTITNYFCDSFSHLGIKYFASKSFFDTTKSKIGLKCDSIFHNYIYIKFPKPTIYISDTTRTMIRGQVLNITANGASTYRWNTTETTSSISISPKYSQSYYVIGWNKYCYDSIGFNITVYSDICHVEFPSAFTPNGDGANDIFIGRPFEGAKIVSFKIFNRLGQLLFYTTDETKGWDGYYKGILQNTEPYFYTYIATSCVPGRMQSGEGNFLLMR